MNLKKYFEYEKNNLNSKSEDFSLILNNIGNDFNYKNQENYSNVYTNKLLSNKVKSPLFATFGLGLLVSAFAFVFFVGQNSGKNILNQNNLAIKYNTVEQAIINNNIQNVTLDSNLKTNNKKENALSLLNNVNSFDSNQVIVSTDEN